MIPLALLLLLALSLWSAASSADDVGLRWDASPEAAGYRMHVGPAPGTYDRVIVLGNVLSYTVPGLDPFRRHYFAVSAYNGATVSGFSNEVARPPRLIPATPFDQTNVRALRTALTLPPPALALAKYQFIGGGSDVGDVGINPLLLLNIADTGAIQWLPGGGLRTQRPALIVSSGPAAKLITAIKASQALTVEAWIEPANTTQFGPARIVALSQNGFPDGGNFVLGQNQAQFEIRLRTSVTNQYGIPALTTPAGTATTGLTHVVYTRNAEGVARAYVNGAEMASGTVGGTLTNWGDYRLALANEPSGGRPWLGTLYRVAIYDRALSGADVRAIFEAGL